MKNLFDNIGAKIMNLAKGVFIIEALGAIITGFSLMIADEDYIGIGLLVMFAGPVAAWVMSWFMYAFGQNTENLAIIAENTRGIKNSTRTTADNTLGGEIKSEAQAKVDSERIAKLERLRAQGLITEEEYRQAVAKDK